MRNYLRRCVIEAVFKSELQDPQAVERPDDLKLAEGRTRNRQALQVEGLAVSQVLICISPCAAPPWSRKVPGGPRRQRTSGEKKTFIAQTMKTKTRTKAWGKLDASPH